MHVLFGAVLARNDDALRLIGLVRTATLAAGGLFSRALVAECLDRLFPRSVSGLGGMVHFRFLGLMVLNLVAGFQALGTLLSMVLPTIAARFGVNTVLAMCLLSVGIVAPPAGLLPSCHASFPPGPAIVLSAGGIYLPSLIAWCAASRAVAPQSPNRLPM